MLTRLEVTSASGNQLDLPLDDYDSGFSVQDITGLDPVPASIVSSSFARQDGEQYQASRREKRNIVLKLGFEPDYSTSSVRELRQTLYGLFMPKSELSLRFVSDDMATVDIPGRVETFDAPLFTQEPSASMSIICFDPDFVDLTPRHLTGNSTAALTETLRTYNGTVETGFVFKLFVDRPISQFSLLNRTSDGVQRRIDFTASLIAGDVLTISTVTGNKYVTLLRAGVETSLLYGFSPYSDWINLFPGNNYMRLAITGAAMAYSIDYTDKYGGL